MAQARRTRASKTKGDRTPVAFINRMISPRRLLVAVVFACLGGVAFAQAAEPRPRLAVAVEDVRATAPGLAAFLECLAAAVEARDAVFVRAQVDAGFACFRDLGGLCDWGEDKGQSNFERLFALEDQETDPESAGWGWEQLGALLTARTVGPVAEDDMLNGEAAGLGLVCGPAPPLPASRNAVERAVGEDYWFLWAYVESAGVRLRAGPTHEAAVLEKLSFEAVALTERDARPGPGAPEGWVSVVGPGGREGWVAGRFVQSFVAPRLCYGQGADGDWLIKAHIGGGD